MRWRDEAACAQTAAALAGRPELRDASIELRGTLGAGKTSFVRHLLRALGVAGRVKSPSYAVVEAYAIDTAEGPLQAWHFDFYRFDDPHEWEDAGFRDLYAEPGLKLAEWPEKAEGLLPEADLQMRISIEDGDAREVRFDALSARGSALMAAIDVAHSA